MFQGDLIKFLWREVLIERNFLAENVHFLAENFPKNSSEAYLILVLLCLNSLQAQDFFKFQHKCPI